MKGREREYVFHPVRRIARGEKLSWMLWWQNTTISVTHFPHTGNTILHVIMFRKGLDSGDSLKGKEDQIMVVLFHLSLLLSTVTEPTQKWATLNGLSAKYEPRPFRVSVFDPKVCVTPIVIVFFTEATQGILNPIIKVWSKGVTWKLFRLVKNGTCPVGTLGSPFWPLRFYNLSH